MEIGELWQLYEKDRGVIFPIVVPRGCESYVTSPFSNWIVPSRRQQMHESIKAILPSRCDLCEAVCSPQPLARWELDQFKADKSVVMRLKDIAAVCESCRELCSVPEVLHAVINSELGHTEKLDSLRAHWVAARKLIPKRDEEDSYTQFSQILGLAASLRVLLSTGTSIRWCDSTGSEIDPNQDFVALAQSSRNKGTKKLRK